MINSVVSPPACFSQEVLGAGSVGVHRIGKKQVCRNKQTQSRQGPTTQSRHGGVCACGLDLTAEGASELRLQ